MLVISCYQWSVTGNSRRTVGNDPKTIRLRVLRSEFASAFRQRARLQSTSRMASRSSAYAHLLISNPSLMSCDSYDILLCLGHRISSSTSPGKDRMVSRDVVDGPKCGPFLADCLNLLMTKLSQLLSTRLLRPCLCGVAQRPNCRLLR